MQSNGQWEAVLTTEDPGYVLRLLALAAEVGDPRVTAWRVAARAKVRRPLSLVFVTTHEHVLGMEWLV